MRKGNISIFELLAVAREVQDSDYVKGDSMLCERRFRAQTRHMIEYSVIGTHTEMGSPGAYCRRFLTEESYREALRLIEKGEICIKKHAIVERGNLRYEPVSCKQNQKGKE